MDYNAAVTGWGWYSPAQVLSNQDLEKLVDTNDDWIQSRTGLRERRIAFDCTTEEFPRVFAHEIAHFIWIRLGNPRRRSWEDLVRVEISAHAAGELGWSAEWRKAALSAGDVADRTRGWREYCCESFCDTAAWLWSGVGRHPEFTLAGKLRAIRRKWFAACVDSHRLSI